MIAATPVRRPQFAMLTDAASQIHEMVDLPVTSILFDRRSGAIHKMGAPAAIAAFAETMRVSLRAAGLVRLAEDASVVTAAFTRGERDRFANEPRSILRDERVRALPTTPAWHDCRVQPVNGVVPASECHLSWEAHLDGALFGKFETRDAAEQALIDETDAIAPLRAQI